MTSRGRTIDGKIQAVVGDLNLLLKNLMPDNMKIEAGDFDEFFHRYFDAIGGVSDLLRGSKNEQEAFDAAKGAATEINYSLHSAYSVSEQDLPEYIIVVSLLLKHFFGLAVEQNFLENFGASEKGIKFLDQIV